MVCFLVFHKPSYDLKGAISKDSKENWNARIIFGNMSHDHFRNLDWSRNFLNTFFFHAALLFQHKAIFYNYEVPL